jgi:flagellar biosynthesis/type III secretory pathway protein FliH
MEYENGDTAMKARYINPNREYEESLKVYRDLKGVVDTSYEEGLEEGVMIGEERGLKKGEKKKALEMARMMKKKVTRLKRSPS